MIKQINDELYEVICGWWEKKGSKFDIAKEVLYEGYASFIENKPIFSAYLYHQNALGWLAWVAANPESDSRERKVGMKLLVDGITEIASGRGIRLIWTPTNNASLISRFEDNGFLKYDCDVVHLLKLV
jgi:hypothetical protein